MPAQRYTPHLDTDGLSPQTSHPSYVAVAPDSFWSESDTMAPFGSDSGSDMLRALEEHYHAGRGDGHAPGCVAEVIGDWALVPDEIWESSQPEIVAWLDADGEHIGFIHAEIAAFVAGAIGQFKISGSIHPLLRFWAERALMLLEHVIDPWEIERSGAPVGRYVDRLAETRAVIAAAPEPPRRFQLRAYAPGR